MDSLGSKFAGGLAAVTLSVTLASVASHAGVESAKPGGPVTPGETCALAKNRAVEQRLTTQLKCYRKARLDQSAVDGQCLAAAEAKFVTAIAKAESKGGCIHPNDGEELKYATDSFVDYLVGYLTPPHARCGDQYVSPGEECDPYAYPNGCDETLGCDYTSCTCGPVCADGLLSPGETCDPYAFPDDGCADGTVCSSDCSGCVVPPAGYCVPTTADTCNAGLHACSQVCDNNTPGSACVSTSPDGDVACVQQICTFRTCNTSVDCSADEVCFTEGCCGSPGASANLSAAARSWK